MARNKHLFESGVYLSTDIIVHLGVAVTRAAISRLAGVALATLLAGCASPVLNRSVLAGRSHDAPAAIEVSQNDRLPTTRVVAYRPVSVEIDAAELPPSEPPVVECSQRDPFAVHEEQSDHSDSDSSGRLLGQTLFRDPGLSVPFTVRPMWNSVKTVESAPLPPFHDATSPLDSPRFRGSYASTTPRFDRALASNNNPWCRFRVSPPRHDAVLVARANGCDEFAESLSGGYSSPDVYPECGEYQGDDSDGCGIAQIDGDCPCCRPRRLSFRQDMYDAIRIGKADFVDLLTVQNAVVLGVAGGAAAILHRNVDPQVRDWTAEHPDRWGHATNFLGDLGNPWVQGGMLTGVYAYGLWTQDEEIHELSLALVGAWKITAIGTVALKYAVHTNRPSDDHLHSVWEGGQYGFPSIEASTSFAMAAVFDSFYGLKAGIPAYMLAGLISWSRIDTRDSDLSDVMFGAVFGYVVGKSVAIHHIENAYGFKLQPYTHPTSGAPGVSLNFAF